MVNQRLYPISELLISNHYIFSFVNKKFDYLHYKYFEHLNMYFHNDIVIIASVEMNTVWLMYLSLEFVYKYDLMFSFLMNILRIIG